MGDRPLLPKQSLYSFGDGGFAQSPSISKFESQEIVSSVRRLRQSKRPQIKEQYWDSIKLRFEKLYIEDDFPLKQVMTLLAKDGFQATEAQYKSKIREWGLEKNVRSKEMRHIIRIQDEQRRLDSQKESDYYVRGRLVSEAKIERFLHEKPGLPLPLSATPSVISRRTRASGSPASDSSMMDVSPAPSIIVDDKDEDLALGIPETAHWIPQHLLTDRLLALLREEAPIRDPDDAIACPGFSFLWSQFCALCIHLRLPFEMQPLTKGFPCLLKLAGKEELKICLDIAQNREQLERLGLDPKSSLEQLTSVTDSAEQEAMIRRMKARRRAFALLISVQKLSRLQRQCMLVNSRLRNDPFPLNMFLIEMDILDCIREGCKDLLERVKMMQAFNTLCDEFIGQRHLLIGRPP